MSVTIWLTLLFYWMSHRLVQIHWLFKSSHGSVVESHWLVCSWPFFLLFFFFYSFFFIFFFFRFKINFLFFFFFFFMRLILVVSIYLYNHINIYVIFDFHFETVNYVASFHQRSWSVCPFHWVPFSSFFWLGRRRQHPESGVKLWRDFFNISFCRRSVGWR